MRPILLTCGIAALLAACLETTVGPDTGETAHVLTRDELLVSRAGFWQVSAIGGDRGTRWREPGYSSWNEPNWNGYSAPWGYGETWLRSVIPYGPDAGNKPPTVYGIHTFHVGDPAQIRGLRLEMQYDDGVVVYLNGTEVARRSMPAGPITYGTLAGGHEGPSETIDLGAHVGLLVAGNDNRLQVEVHQVSQSSSDLVFAAELIAQVQDPPPPPAEGFIARRSEWSYWDAGGDLGTAWRLPGYDVSQWHRGGGPLGYGESYLATQTSVGASSKPITTYFRRDIYVAEPTAIKHLLGRVMYDDGVVVYLNGTEIQRLSMPTGTITYTTPALGHEATAGTYTPYHWDAAIPLLVAGINTLAIEVHQHSASSSDLVFDLELLLYLVSGEDPPPTGRASVARRSTWSYWDQGGDLGTAWRAAAYADGSWATGAGPLGYGEPYLATTVGYGGNAADKHPTTYFRKHLDVDLSGGATVIGLYTEVMYDDGVVIYLNGQEVKRLAMPAGTVTATTRSTGHEANNAYETYDLAAFGHLLVDGDNVIAVEVHQLSAGSSDLVFDLALEVTIGDGGAVTTPVFTPYSGNPIVEPSFDPEGPTRWRQDTVGDPEVVRAGGQWALYYDANDGLGNHHMTGRGLSSDGLSWTLDEEPTAGGELESVVHDGTRYYLYTVDPHGLYGVSVRTSTDGQNWQGGYPSVVETGDRAAVSYDGTWFEMWSTAVGHVVYSTSPDGVTWTTHGIILGLISDGGFDVLKEGDRYHAWDVTAEGIWYLTSTDGLHWRRHGLSLAPPSPGAWDERGDGSPSVIRDGDTLRMYYQGRGGDFSNRIGVAIAPSPAP